MRVLIVEGDLRQLHAYRETLSAAGLEVYQAASLQAAHELLRKHRFAMVLCDLHLSHHHSGTELLSYAPRLTSEGTRFIVISLQERYRDLCRSMEIEFYLKPVSPSDVLAIVGGEAAV